jgi:hypothetical protein
VLLDVEIGAAFRRVDVVIQALGLDESRMTSLDYLVPGQVAEFWHASSSAVVDRSFVE